MLSQTYQEVDRSDAIDVMEDFFLQIGAEIKKRKPDSLSAFVEHPDGMDVYIKIKYYEEKKYVVATQRCGDHSFFLLLTDLILKYDFGNGDTPSIYLGQLCPRVKPTPEDPTTLPPDFSLDLNLKRKRA